MREIERDRVGGVVDDGVRVERSGDGASLVRGRVERRLIRRRE